MKKLNKLKLHKNAIMGNDEMKIVMGGYGGSGTKDDPYYLPEAEVSACGICAQARKYIRENIAPSDQARHYIQLGATHLLFH